MKLNKKPETYALLRMLRKLKQHADRAKEQRDDALRQLTFVRSEGIGNGPQRSHKFLMKFERARRAAETADMFADDALRACNSLQNMIGLGEVEL